MSKQGEIAGEAIYVPKELRELWRDIAEEELAAYVTELLPEPWFAAGPLLDRLLLQFYKHFSEQLLSKEPIHELTKEIVEGSDGEVISLPYAVVEDALRERLAALQAWKHMKRWELKERDDE